MQKIKRFIFDFYLFSKKFGLEGLIFCCKRIIFPNQIISFNHSSFLNAIYVRNNTSDISIFKQMLVYEDYSIDYTSNVKTIIDCGANIGLATVFFKNKFPNATIISIEPEHSNFELLKKNTTKYPNVICLNVGLWNKCTNLIIKDLNIGNYAFMVEEVVDKIPNSIPALSLNDIVNTYQISQIDILKIDIEGSEKEVFESNYENWLSITKLIIIELHDNMREGASSAFYKTITNYKHVVSQVGENIFCLFKH